MEQPKIHIFNNSRDRIFVPENCTGRIKNLIRTEKNTAPVMRESDVIFYIRWISGSGRIA